MSFYEIPSVDEGWTIAEVAEKCTPPTWERVFEECKSTIRHTSKLLEGKTVYPLKKDIFRAFYLTPADKVKVIILGQDPYPSLIDGKPRAQGLAFSVSPKDDIPASLKNIFKEIAGSYPDFRYSSGCLSDWAKQGVLLLNTALTYCPEDKDPHVVLWKHFVVTVISEVCARNDGCVAILLGSHAQGYSKFLKSNVKTLEASHPSGRSAFISFLGSGIFKKCNDLLSEIGHTPIDWSIY